EHEVDVGAVIQLLPAEFAKSDHGHAALAAHSRFSGKVGRSVFRNQLSTNDVVAHIEDAIGEARQLLGNFRQCAEAQHVANKDAENLSPTEHSHTQREHRTG